MILLSPTSAAKRDPASMKFLLAREIARLDSARRNPSRSHDVRMRRGFFLLGPFLALLKVGDFHRHWPAILIGVIALSVVAVCPLVPRNVDDLRLDVDAVRLTGDEEGARRYLATPEAHCFWHDGSTLPPPEERLLNLSHARRSWPGGSGEATSQAKVLD